MRHEAPARRRRLRGFTFVELIIALAMGVLVLSAAIAYVIREMRTLAGSEIRQSLSRNARYIGSSLRHDVQRAGIEITSTTTFGTVAVWPGTFGDTVVILHVPYQPDVAPAHVIVPPFGIDNPLPPGGTCGARCVEVLKDDVEPLDLRVGDLARLQIPGTRHLILITELDEVTDTSVQISFTAADTIVRQPAGLEDGMLLDRFGTIIQKLELVAYYLDDQEQLMRAGRLKLDGSPEGHILAYGVERFDVKLVFADGDELETANSNDLDDSNDFDDIVAVKIAVTVKADAADPRVNEGEILRRQYEWTISPRNLRYEKFRI
jgi:type II secretory pathway pseudopilin PulG